MLVVLILACIKETEKTDNDPRYKTYPSEPDTTVYIDTLSPDVYVLIEKRTSPDKYVFHEFHDHEMKKDTMYYREEEYFVEVLELYETTFKGSFTKENFSQFYIENPEFYQLSDIGPLHADSIIGQRYIRLRTIFGVPDTDNSHSYYICLKDSVVEKIEMHD